MRRYKTILQPKRVIDTVRCNCCGKVIQDSEFFSAVKHWGYDSPYDTEVHAMLYRLDPKLSDLAGAYGR